MKIKKILLKIIQEIPLIPIWLLLARLQEKKIEIKKLISRNKRQFLI